MLRLYRLRHHGRPLYAAERNGHWRLVDGDIFGAFTEGAEIAVDGLAWLPPVTPATFVGVESNYKPVVVGDGDGAPWADEPALFLKPASAVAAPGAAIEIPRGIGRVDAQASVGVVMRKSTRRVLAARAADHILGLVAVNDVVARDVTAMTGQTTRARGFDSFAPVGPCIAVGLDARDLEVRMYVNGQLRQDSRTRHMVFTIPELVEYVSATMALEAGDIISSGSPAGSGPIEPGDQVTVHVEGIGALTNSVVWRGE